MAALSIYGWLTGRPYLVRLQMATCRGFDPLSLARQASRITRCATGHGVHGVTRTPTERVLNAVPLPLGYMDELVDLRGVEPRARGLRGRRSADELKVRGEPARNRTVFSWVKRPACYHPTPGPDQDPRLMWRAARAAHFSATRASVAWLSGERIWTPAGNPALAQSHHADMSVSTFGQSVDSIMRRKLSALICCKAVMTSSVEWLSRPVSIRLFAVIGRAP